MLAYDGSHILYTAIAYFNVVLVEKGVILELSRKVFRYQLKEGEDEIASVTLSGIILLSAAT